MQDLRAALQSARRLYRSGGGTVLDVLSRNGPIPPAELDRALRSQAGVSAVFDADAMQIDHAVLSRERAQQLCCVPFRLVGESELWIGMADPWDDSQVQGICQALGVLPQLAALSSAALSPWIGANASEQHPSKGIGPVDSPPDVQPGGAAAGPVVDFVDVAIKAGFTQGASDIHFECGRAGVVVKLRQDGDCS